MEVKKNFLVLGSAPCLLDELKGKDLSGFDKVVRINMWQPIEGYDNRCTTWLYYPLHGLEEKGPHHGYDIVPYLDMGTEIWIGHQLALRAAYRQLGKREPGKIFTDENKAIFQNSSGILVPTTGLIAIWMALHEQAVVYVAGFDFYKSSLAGDTDQHYFKDPQPLTNNHHPHNLDLEYKWYHEQLEKGVLRRL